MNNSGKKKIISELPIIDKFDDYESYDYFYIKDLQSNCSLISQVFPFFIHQFFLFNVSNEEIGDLWNAFMKPNETDKDLKLYSHLVDTFANLIENPFINMEHYSNIKEFINNIVDYENGKEPIIDKKFCKQFFKEYIKKNAMKNTFDFISTQIQKIINQSYEVFHQDQTNINLFCSIFGSKITFYKETQFGTQCYKPDKTFKRINNISFGILMTSDNRLFYLSKGDNVLIHQYKVKLDEILQLYLQKLHNIVKFVEQLNIQDKSIDAEDFLNHASGIIIIKQNSKITKINLIEKITALIKMSMNYPLKFDKLINRCINLKDKMIKDRRIIEDLKSGNFKEKVALIKEMFGGNFKQMKCLLCNNMFFMNKIASNSCSHSYCKQCISEEINIFMKKIQLNKSPFLLKCPFPNCYSLLSNEIIFLSIKNTKWENIYNNFLATLSAQIDQVKKCMFCGLNENNNSLILSHSNHYFCSLCARYYLQSQIPYYITLKKKGSTFDKTDFGKIDCPLCLAMNLNGDHQIEVNPLFYKIFNQNEEQNIIYKALDIGNMKDILIKEKLYDQDPVIRCYYCDENTGSTKALTPLPDCEKTCRFRYCLIHKLDAFKNIVELKVCVDCKKQVSEPELQKMRKFIEEQEKVKIIKCHKCEKLKSVEFKMCKQLEECLKANCTTYSCIECGKTIAEEAFRGGDNVLPCKHSIDNNEAMEMMDGTFI